MIEGVPLREALNLPALDGARVLAGANGLSRRVRYVNVMEVPDILDWVKPDELLLTTAYPLRDDRAALVELVPRLAQKGLAGLAVKPARYIDAVPQPMLEAADRLSFPLLELPPRTALADIINAVLGLILNQQALRLARSAAVHERFTTIALGGGGAREIAHALAELIERPVALFDLQADLLARSSDFALRQEEWSALVQRVESGPLHWVSRADGCSAAVQPIQAGADVHGATVVLAEPDTLADDDLMAIEQASTVAALRLVQARAVAEADRRFQATCLDELVTGHLTERAVLNERAAAFGWDLSMPRAVLVAEIETFGGRRFVELAGTADEGRARHRVAEAARGLLGREAIIWERSAGIAILALADGTRSGLLLDSARTLQAAIAGRQPGIVTRIGIGRVYTDPLQLRASFTEAMRALTVGRRTDGVDSVWEYDALGLSRLLLACPQPELATFHAEVLGPLLAFEHDHAGSELLVTLEAFLGTNRNAAAAARALFVHYNTVRYRLERIEQLIGPFVDDSSRCLTLDLALHAGRLLALQ
jgi:PucR family transcriptional regulator, purine catabolism regulatory protein